MPHYWKLGPLLVVNDVSYGHYVAFWPTLPWGLESIHVGMCIGGVGKKCLRINLYPFKWQFYGWLVQGPQILLGPINIDQGIRA